MYVAVRVRAELTQDDQYHQELAMTVSNISDLYQLNDFGAEKCRRQVRCCEFTSNVRDALKEKPSNSMADFVMQKQDGKGRDREERNEWFRAPRR